MTFKSSADIEREEHDWGTFAAVSSPADGAERIMTVEAVFLPGKSHAFHRHPHQEEVIYVLEGELEQWVEDERRLLGAGDAVVIPAAVVHASYNESDRPAKILAILSPCVGEAGYEVEELADVEPWRSMRGGA
ncbi:MAG TPA: cupin domain-containing protein [Gaiellaceae bacterium]|jgi:quercetin dioxygenase-like cupin family protein|nr:cupin domain-containing protein [Gaiellaceae bacterium]